MTNNKWSIKKEESVGETLMLLANKYNYHTNKTYFLELFNKHCRFLKGSAFSIDKPSAHFRFGDFETPSTAKSAPSNEVFCLYAVFNLIIR